MRIFHPTCFAGGMALAALSSLAVAQAVAPATGALPAIHGEFERLTLTPRGDIDGLILKDGTEVKTSPDLAAQIGPVLKAGDRVTIRGLRAAALPLVRAVSISTDATQRTFAETAVAAPKAPPAPGSVRPPPGATARGTTSETSGRVRMALHGPQGEVNGVLLESGTMLRFPPVQAAQVNAMVQPRQPVVAEGVSRSNAFGTVVEVEQLGPSRDRLVAVGPPAPPPGPIPPAPPGAG